MNETTTTTSDEEIEQLIKWLIQAMHATKQAGGNADAIVRTMPPSVIRQLARNNIYLVHTRPAS